MEDKPIDIDYVTAKDSYELENPGMKFEDLTTRKRNSLARSEMFHRHYHAICDAIKGFR
jgi:hypothetical protein